MVNSNQSDSDERGSFVKLRSIAKGRLVQDSVGSRRITRYFALLVLHAAFVAISLGLSHAGPFWSAFEFGPQPGSICRSTLLTVGRDNGVV
jgi:hypothetical protein